MVEKILLIDDDEIFQLTASFTLKKMFPQAEIIIAHNGEDGFKKLSTFQPDLIFLDISMPVMNGWEFLDTYQRKEMPNNTPIYLLSSSIDPSDRQKASFDPNVTAFIEKPLSVEKLQILKTV